MAIIEEQEIRVETAKGVAGRMLLAARTAPKARGVDNIECAMVDGADLERIAATLDVLSERLKLAFLARDAKNVRQSACVVIIGTKIAALGLNCGLCGCATCEEKNKNAATPCVFNTGDLGIAIGSAVGVAADCRVDNRVMFSIGLAVRELGLLGADVKIIYGIPLSVSGKSPFFDRV